MIPNTGHVMTLANSIIGVGILAMPYCFLKCGIVLSILLLAISNLITRISCHYLIKSSILTRRKSFEFLAFHTFGSSGKLMVELCIIGYLIGTCIAYFVVIGDLGPQITAKVLHIQETDRLRTWIMCIVTVLCIIPLGLLKNVDSLSAVCTASIGFYFCLVLKVILESHGNIMANDWSQYVVFWRPAGVLQCLPIFSMALSCQMQLFEVQETVPNISVEKMNAIVKNATMICTYVYVFVGFFGYVAFCKQPFAGNILINFSPSLASDAIKLGFVLSVAFSFPLVIFPCRASIYSLLYRRGHGDTSAYIPETRFKAITISIAFFSLAIALLIPSIELVIGLVGSTIGVAICIMFPASCFMKVIKKESTEKLVAQFILIGGFCLMILGTYANLHAIDEKRSGSVVAVKEEVKKINEKLFETATRFENLSEVKSVKPRVNVESESGGSNKRKVDIQLPPSLSKDDKAQKEKTVLESKGPIKLNKPDIEKRKEKNVNSVEKIDTRVVEPSIVMSKLVPNLTKNGINKDAIIKEEQVVAEEEQKEKNVEIEKTKELIKQKVFELEEELDKRNKETQNMVQEKLEDIAEHVQEIERKAGLQENKNDQIAAKEVKEEKVDTDLKNKIESILDTTNVKIDNKIKNQLLSNSDTNNEQVKEKKVNIKQVDPVIVEKPLDGKKEENAAAATVVYEPKSYKVGERMLEKLGGMNLEKGKILPLPLLLNSSLQKGAPLMAEPIKAQPAIDVKLQVSTEKDTLKMKAKADEKQVKIVNEKVDNEEKHVPKDSQVDAMRREILQVATDTSKPSESDLTQRLKRSITNDVCRESNFQIVGCLENEILNMDIKNLIDTKSVAIGRDLKSVDETDES